MASLADKNLPQAAQDKINQITADAQAGKISWADANKQANQVRQDNGADYTVSANGTTTYDDNSTISSYKTGSQTSGGKASGGSPELVKGPGYVTGGYQTGAYGTAIQGDGSDANGNGDVVNLAHEQVRTLMFVYRGGGFDNKLREAGLVPAVK